MAFTLTVLIFTYKKCQTIKNAYLDPEKNTCPYFYPYTF